MNKIKPYNISKKSVWEAYERVKANKGSAGIDEQSIEDFEIDLKNNLYKIWNRMSSGTYFPPPVKTVAIPKKTGGERKLGIPTVSDRIAQMLVKMNLEPHVDPIFHEDSFGYRPNKSALQAVEKAKKRCWEYNWVIDLDIKGFFDNIDHELLIRAVRKHTNEKWIIMHIERWLKAPAQLADGTIIVRDKGTPQGGVVSPLLANLFLHYAFDVWMGQNHGKIKFERYADDVIIHCSNLNDAKYVLESVKARLQNCKLELHPEKTKIVHCQDAKRSSGWGYEVSFDFLGFTFRRRTARGKDGRFYDGFLPAISKDARKKISATIRTWRLSSQTDKSLEELSEKYNPVLRGWFNYYGKFYKSEMMIIHQQIQFMLTRWALRKYKSLGSKTQAGIWLYEITRKEPHLFANWSNFYNSGSRMTGAV
jgi:RNA-directed DNA polymerase